MRPETEAKIIVSFLISLIAFGCGSGLGIFIGLSNDNITAMDINDTPSSDVQLSPSSTNHLPLNGIKDRGREEVQNSYGEVNVVNSKQGSSNNTTF
ncbi:hypothetical protein [Methanothermobacter sp.]|uniref:hypothetical protein n=1 Tax=Methanothermobacter sp. TaxID=1884223 RepID=UPI0026122F6B|nr:hypothetical protein [Methanothermobacter sp.]MDI9618858.1 hypothetical protein [Methanothermobacter sp.]